MLPGENRSIGHRSITSLFLKYLLFSGNHKAGYFQERFLNSSLMKFIPETTGGFSFLR